MGDRFASSTLDTIQRNRNEEASEAMAPAHLRALFWEQMRLHIDTEEPTDWAVESTTVSVGMGKPFAAIRDKGPRRPGGYTPAKEDGNYRLSLPVAEAGEKD